MIPSVLQTHQRMEELGNLVEKLVTKWMTWPVLIGSVNCGEFFLCSC
jgi:hypothetical protein